MKRLTLYVAAVMLCASSVASAAAPGAPSTVSAKEDSKRTILSLDGTWQIAEGKMDQVPAAFDRTVPVPGLVSLATPPFHAAGPKVANRQSLSQKDPLRDAFWYRRTFAIDGPVPAVARLKVAKAMFGTRVYLNGTPLGDHAPCFTPGYFDAKPSLKTGDNEILIRVGADRDAVGREHPDGFDFEKEQYIPGIFDSVQLILSGTPHIVTLQAAPEVAAKAVHVQALLHNDGPAAVKAAVAFVVRQTKSGKLAGQATSEPVELAKGAEATVDVRIPLEDCRLWSPEDPFLYTLEATSGADSSRTRFGMREFKFDPASGRAVLNGKPYYLRGSNITLYRFFEDSERGKLPWDENWVRLLHQRVKEMHWNCLRYCIGFPPEAWYDIADEAGILIDDEFPIWYGGNIPKALDSDELAKEYSEWMRERWNHPCVAIWDSCNETLEPKIGVAIKQVRSLDLSNRPWDDGYSYPQQPGDSFESHPYHFGNPTFRLANLATADPVPQGSRSHNDGKHAVVINEYGWLWLNRDGTPTTLTSQLYQNLLGANSTTEQRFHLQATYIAAETEFWRAHRNAAAVMHFTTLGYARPDGQTSDHWTAGGVAKLQWEPEFYRYVRDSFAPVGLMIDAWDDEYPAGQARSFPVVVTNDLDEEWLGSVQLRLVRDGRVVEQQSQACTVAAMGQQRLAFSLVVPKQTGRYQVEAALVKPGAETVRSLREFSVLTAEERLARNGLAAGKPVTASSNIVKSGATSPAAVVDGNPQTRWSSQFSDPQWIAVDLEKVQRISRVVLDWEAAYAKAYAIEVSVDGATWKQVYHTDRGQGGRAVIRFAPTEARWVRMFGTRRATPFGYSLWEFGVFAQ